MKNKRIFVGLDYRSPHYYLTGLSSSFEWLFHRYYHMDDSLAMYAFLNSFNKKYRDLIYRLPVFNCQFKTYGFEQFLSIQDVYQRTQVYQLKHAVDYLGLHAKRHQYQVAYVSARYYDEQLSFLGPVRTMLTRVDIDVFALWFYRSQQHPKPGLIRCLEYQHHRLYGRDECLWLEGLRGLDVDVFDVLDDSAWHIAESLAFGAYYHGL